MFLAYIFQYLVQLHFLMLMIFLLLFLLVHIGGTSGLFSVYFPYYLTGQPGSACPSPSPRPSLFTGAPRRISPQFHTPLSPLTVHFSTLPESSDGSAIGSPRLWKPPRTS